MHHKPSLILLIAALFWSAIGVAAFAADPTPITPTQIDSVLAAYQDIADAKLGTFDFIPDRSTDASTGDLRIGKLPLPTAPDPRITAIVQKHGLRDHEEWANLLGRILLAHRIDFTRSILAGQQQTRQKIAGSPTMNDETKAGLLARMDDLEPKLVAMVGQAEVDAPVVATFAERLKRMFPNAAKAAQEP